MTISEMQSLKQEYGFSCRFIADESGVPFGTVQKIFGGSTASPRQVTLKSLTEFFEKNTSIGKTYKNYSDAYQMNEPEANYTGTSAYKITDDDRKLETDDQKHQNDGGKTIKDYLSLPEGTRVELIDGKFYDMAAPTTIHQHVSGLIYYQLLGFIDSNGGDCVPFDAPTDVQLDCDDKTIVQPDVLVVCDRDKITEARIVGAPDLVVEVVSPSNWNIDTFIKFKKYKKAGVREYWIILPRQQKIVVFCFEKSDDFVEYTFNDKVPVGIWEGKCEVDFKRIYENIKFLYEKSGNASN